MGSEESLYPQSNLEWERQDITFTNMFILLYLFFYLVYFINAGWSLESDKSFHCKLYFV